MPQTRRLRKTRSTASFSISDTAETPQQVGWVIRFDGEPPRWPNSRAHVEPRLEQLPLFKMRIARAERRLGGPNGYRPMTSTSTRTSWPRERRATTASARSPASCSQRLTRDRPLWRLWLVDGLDSGFAVIGHGHHTLIDGVAAVEVAMLQLDPLETTPETAVVRITATTVPEIRPTANKTRRRRRREGRARRRLRGARHDGAARPRTMLDDAGDGTRSIGLGATDLRVARTTAARERRDGKRRAPCGFGARPDRRAGLTWRNSPWLRVLMPFRQLAHSRGRAAGNESRR